MKIYISGPITGHAYNWVEAKFRTAEKELKGLGYDPVNPLDNGLPRSAPWIRHIGRDIELLLECGAIYMLEGWQESKGARIELAVAVEHGINVRFQPKYTN